MTRSSTTADPDRPTAGEEPLVQRLKARDADAFEEIVRTLGGRMLAVARRFLADDELARDVVQEAFLAAFRGIQRFDGHAQLSTWLHRIVVNTALMKIRSQQRRPEQSIEPLLPSFAKDGHHAEPVVSWADSGERVLEQQETCALVRGAIAELPATYRTILLMRDIEDLSTRETADALGISENAVKLRLHRARQALATLIKRRLAATQERHGSIRMQKARPRADVETPLEAHLADPSVHAPPLTCLRASLRMTYRPSAGGRHV
jgi:RNA polymerase sigma-70 factor, ECF subfamily